MLGLFLVDFEAVGTLFLLKLLEIVTGDVAGWQGLLDRLGNVDGFEAHGAVALVVGPVISERSELEVGEGFFDGAGVAGEVEGACGSRDASDGFFLKLGDLRPIEVFGERDELLAAGEVELFPGAAPEFPGDG